MKLSIVMPVTVVFSIFFAKPTYAQFESHCHRNSLPNPTEATVTVSDVAELTDAAQQANADGNLTILLEDGTYTLSKVLWITGNDVTFRSRSGNRDAVVIRGQGMHGNVSHIFNVTGSRFTVADMTIGWVANHGIQIHGENDADAPLIHNVRVVDTWEQMLKVSFRKGDRTSSDNGVVEWCVFEYSEGMGPQWYIGGIDAHQVHNWIIRNNIFTGIRSPEWRLAEHAIHLRSESTDTVVEKNIITNSDRGIGFGLDYGEGHHRGMICNNMVHTNRDVGIYLANSTDTRVYHNTVYTEYYNNSIEYRFPRSRGISIINNLTNARITSRDKGSARVVNNVTNARASWFINAIRGDLHLAVVEPIVVNQGQPLWDITVDIDCETRPQGAAFDIGADEMGRISPITITAKKYHINSF